jgi:hypothetical protein
MIGTVRLRLYVLLLSSQSPLSCYGTTDSQLRTILGEINASTIILLDRKDRVMIGYVITAVTQFKVHN